jgi:hypothetical protein
MKAMLPSVVEPLAIGPVEVLDPVSHELAEASPTIERLASCSSGSPARRRSAPSACTRSMSSSPPTAVDMTVDSVACALLHGETDTSGYPDYTAIVGGWPATGTSSPAT